MSVNLEDLVARVRLDTSGLRAGMASASSALSGAGSSMKSAGSSMTRSLTLPLAAAAAGAVKLAGDFDATMRKVGIATGTATGPLRELAMEMGAKTAFSAGEASDAMLELAKGGMTAAQIQAGALESTMVLAAAGEVALGESATYVSNAMNQFGIQASKANDVAVALAGGANASSASVQSLGYGLAQVGGIAASAGMTLNETVGALSAFDAAGLKGSDAGTSLKAMMNTLIPTTEKAEVAMEQLGLQTAEGDNAFLKANGDFEDMSTIAGKLQGALKGLSEGQRNLALETIFGADGMRAANALANTGEAGIRRYTKATKDQATTTKLAEAGMSGINGAIERAKGSMETAAIVLGTALAPAVVKVAGAVESAANVFGSLSPEMMTVVAVVGGVIAALGPLLMIVGSVASGLGAIAGVAASISGAFAAAGAAATAAGGGMAGLSAALGVLISPVLLVVGALALVAGAFYLAYTRSEAFRGYVQAGMAAVSDTIQTTVIPAALRIRDAFMGLVAAVIPIVMQLVGVVRSNLPQIQAVVAQVFGTVRTIVVTVMTAVRVAIQVATSVITGLWGVFGGVIMATVKRVFPAVLSIIRGVLNVVQGVFRAFSALIKGDWSGLWSAVKQILSGAWQVIAGIFRGAFALLRGIVSAAWAGLKALFSAGIDKVVGDIKAFPSQAKSALGDLGGVLRDAGSALIQGLVDGIEAKIESAVDAVRDGLGKIRDLLPGSPIKDGPLKGWNNTGPTGPGGQLVGLLAQGVSNNSGALRAAMAGAAAGVSATTAGRGGGSLGSPGSLRGRTQVPYEIRVFIGDRELTDMVRVEVGGVLSPLAQMARQGAI